MTNILVIAAHPDLYQSRVNRKLLDAARSLESDSLQVRDLYALYPDYLIDVDAEQAALERADLVVWQHPFHWYSMPPLMKLWLDEVFDFGWAYGHVGDHAGRALHGKDLWLVISAGGGETAYHPSGYNRYFFDAFMPPYEQTAALCGMHFLPPVVMYASQRADTQTLNEHAQRYRDLLSSYPRWPEIEALEPREGCDVPEDDRPHGELAREDA